MSSSKIAPLVLLAWIVALAANAQPVAEKPVIIIGDTWEFTRTSSAGKNESWSRKVIEVPSADRLRVQFEDNAVSDYDAVLNFMPEGNPDYARVLVRYPLKVGDEWALSRRFPNPGREETGKAKVVAYEPITVPAGTFQCYRVEAEATQVAGRAKEIRNWKRWYCPEVKWIAKEVLETVTGGTGSRIGGSSTETSELVKFTPGK